MELVNETFFVYSMDKSQNEILEEFHFDDKESAMDMAYRLSKYSPKTFIRKEYTYEVEEGDIYHID